MCSCRSLGQNFNRYSYCLNNPLKYNDPDGEWIHLLIGAIVGGVINTIAHRDQIDNFGDGLAAFELELAVECLRQQQEEPYWVHLELQQLYQQELVVF